jgi:hypothetical protein
MAHYGADIVVALGGLLGVDHSFAEVCRRLNVTLVLVLPDYHRIGDYQHANQKILSKGAELCLIVRLGPLDDATRDLAEQVLASGVPTWRIANDRGRLKRMKDSQRLIGGAKTGPSDETGAV